MPKRFTPEEEAIFREAQRCYREHDMEGLAQLCRRTARGWKPFDSLDDLPFPGPTTDHTVSE